MNKGFLLNALLIISIAAQSQDISEGAPVSLKLSATYLVPGTKYIISGETEIGKKPVTLSAEISKTSSSVEKFEITTDAKGGFKTTKTAPSLTGTYTVKITGADGKKSITADFIVSTASDIQAVLKKKMQSAVMLAFKGLEAAKTMVGKLPPSSARDEFNNNYVNTRKGLDEVAGKLMSANNDFNSFMGIAAKYPPVLEETQKYTEQLDAATQEMDNAEKNFEQQIKQSEQQAAICDQLNFISEAAGFVSLVLDFQGKIGKIFINLASDKVMPGALDRMDMSKSGLKGQELENAKFGINSAQKAMVASAQGFNEAKDFAKVGFMLDFIQFCAKGMYGKFCDEMKGPFTGTFRAEFDADEGMWNSYDMAMKGQLILRYEKGGNSNTGFAVTGEFEGVYTKYDFWEDFEKVEKLPKNLILLQRKKIIAKPIDLSTMPAPSVSKDKNTGKLKTGVVDFDINNDVGMIARQMLPGSFLIKVKGVVKDDKITLKVDESAITNLTNIGQKNKLIVIAASPIVPIPLIKVFEFPMAPAKSVFAVGIGPEQVFELKTTGGQTISKKKIDNSRKLDSGSIRLRTTLDITVGSN
jgi:hypothetical protein